MRRRRGRRSGFKIPIISTAILLGQGLLAANVSGGDLGVGFDVFQSFYTGFSFRNRAFDPKSLAIGYAPWLAKRFLLPIARPRMPIHGLPISLS